MSEKALRRTLVATLALTAWILTWVIVIGPAIGPADLPLGCHKSYNPAVGGYVIYGHDCPLVPTPTPVRP